MRYFYVLIVLLSISIFANVPQLLNYQGYIEDSENLPLEGNYDITFTIYDDSLSGIVIWTESHTAVLVRSGLFSVVLGSQTPLNGVFDEPDRYLGVTVGADSEMTPRSRLLSSPYAIKAGQSDNAINADLLNGVMAFELEESDEIVSQLSESIDSLFRLKFNNLFRVHFDGIPSSSNIVFTAPTDKSVYVTNIDIQGGSTSALYIGSERVFRFSNSLSWVSGGAPIEVKPGESLIIDASSSFWVSIIGYVF